MRYIHLSKKPIESLKDIKQTNKSMKPNGLWFSKEKEWINYMDNNSSKELFGLVYQIDLKMPLLKISNKSQIDKFTEKYGTSQKIRWGDVQKDYPGILFDPYLEKVQYPWYSNIDVASGCIWNKNAADIKLIFDKKKNVAIIHPKINLKNKLLLSD